MSDLPSGIPALIEKKVQEERKLIAEWLRQSKVIAGYEFDSYALHALSNAIERGDYRNGAGE